jgi:acetyl-CoA acetyltransferase family protein
MGITAENVADEFEVSRQDMDEFALNSHRKALSAVASGAFNREIVPVVLPDGSVLRLDDGPRPDTSLERLASLQSAFVEGGSVTAGNSCGLNDGAATVLLASREAVDKYGLRPRARILATAVSGVEPERMGVGPIEAVRKVLDRARLTITDIDIVELNEAFAAQVIAVCRVLGIDMKKQLNPHGGAIALGHPFGMTGARLVGALLNDLETSDGTLGLATLCVGGGQGMALVLERIR